ncbi:hypothetical protein [Streptomyces glaucescens]|uniref:Putative membrane protein n=1 Tax=Streptomyces glaucescens TaxID=1907 RepID=A0A089X2S5_STRGA|nr:hypothetical protein [Streptomyces glaucescens]AIR98127.1 putative membrane protein [Streptomyces glaucescens]
MGVIDSEWWALWWPWLVVWAATAACWAVLLRHALIRLGRPRSRRQGGRTVHGMCFFLHEQRVMDLYQQGGFSAALEQEVADRINVTSGVGLRAKFGLGSGKANRDVTEERVTAYIQQSTPITVIRLLMDTMRKEDVVVQADLTTGLIVPNRALADTLREHGGRVPLTSVAVVSAFVSVTGRFTARRSDSGDIVLRAPYGDGPGPAHVRVTCEAAGVREGFQNAEYFTGEFQARCLGKVQTWNGETGELSLNPVAIFL